MKVGHETRAVNKTASVPLALVRKALTDSDSQDSVSKYSSHFFFSFYRYLEQLNELKRGEVSAGEFHQVSFSSANGYVDRS